MSPESSSNVPRSRVLFVDDEEQVLKGLQRTLFGMRAHWDMVFTTQPVEALALMEQREFDVVVSDMLMPGMNGVDFLRRVQQQHPGTIRMILSGHADKDLTLQSLGCTHQFLTKPCPSDQLKLAITRAIHARIALANDALRTVIAKLSSLPTLPSVYTEIQAELQSPSSSLTSVGKIIERDPAMSAKTLQIVNSAFFGIPRSVASVADAASFLGLDLITSLVLSLEVLASFDGLALDVAEHHRIRLHSATTGKLARDIATSLGLASSQVSIAFLAGMLHDVGDLVLLADRPRERQAARELAATERMPLHEAEMRVLGASHARIGGYLMEIWGLPPLLAEAIAFHHEPRLGLSQGVSPLLVVHIASVLAVELIDGVDEDPSSPLDQELLQLLGLKDRIAEWRALARSGTEVGEAA